MGRSTRCPGSFGPVEVAMKKAENMMVLDRPSEVLRMAEHIRGRVSRNGGYR